MLCDLVTWPFKMLGNTHPMTQCHTPADSHLQQECHSIQDTQIILTTSVSVQIVVCNKSSRPAADQQICQDTTTLGPSFKLCNLKCFWTQSHFTERYLFHCSTGFLLISYRKNGLLQKKNATPLLSFLYHFCNFLTRVNQTSRTTVLTLDSMVDAVSHLLSLWPNDARRHKGGK